jgi:hypothetical protein
VARDASQIKLARPNRAHKVFFYELQRLTDATERIIGAVKQGNSPFGAGHNRRICLQAARFIFLDQRYSARWREIYEKNGIDHRFGQAKMSSAQWSRDGSLAS